MAGPDAVANRHLPDKGTPAVRRVRKATGLASERDSQAAEGRSGGAGPTPARRQAVNRLRFPNKDIAVAIALLLVAVIATSADAATKASPNVRSFRPVAHSGSTMLFRVRAVAPERITRTELVLAGRRYPVSVGVVRTALRRKALLRTRLAVAVSARARTRVARRNARLVVYLKPTKKAPARKGQVVADVPGETTTSTTK